MGLAANAVINCGCTMLVKNGGLNSVNLITLLHEDYVSRELIKNKFGGKCAYCGCELGQKWHVDHVKAVFRCSMQETGMRKPENDCIENKFPACVKCNLFKATFSIEELRTEISMQIERARRYSVNFRTAERFGLVEIKQKPVVFWFEQYM